MVKAFDRWASQHGISDESLIKAIDEAERGIVAARLGSDLLKLRIARKGGGKSSGFRTVIAFRRGQRAFFIDGWSKNEQDNIDEGELKALRILAGIYLELADRQLEDMVTHRNLRELKWQK